MITHSKYITILQGLEWKILPQQANILFINIISRELVNLSMLLILVLKRRKFLLNNAKIVAVEKDFFNFILVIKIDNN